MPKSNNPMNLEVLIIDDDEIVVFIEKKMMAKHEISQKPVIFKRALPALDYLRERRGSENQFLILLDINMPGLSGWEFLEEIETWPEKQKFHVVMITSSVTMKDKGKAEKFSRVKEFLEKPITTADCSRIKNIEGLTSFFGES